MNKAQLIEAVAEKLKLSRKEVETMLDTTLDTVIEQLQAGEEVTLTSFGAFSSRVRHARMGVNPQKPDEKMHIPEVRVAKFKTGKGLKEALKAAKVEKSEPVGEPTEK